MLKKIIIFVIVFILVVVVWNLISDDKKDTETLTSSNADGDTALLAEDESQVADTFLNTLLNLHTITLSGDLFSDSRFTSLVDYTIQLTPQPLGRPNPFIPTGASTSTTLTGSTATMGTGATTTGL